AGLVPRAPTGARRGWQGPKPAAQRWREAAQSSPASPSAVARRRARPEVRDCPQLRAAVVRIRARRSGRESPPLPSQWLWPEPEMEQARIQWRQPARAGFRALLCSRYWRRCPLAPVVHLSLAWALARGEERRSAIPRTKPARLPRELFCAKLLPGAATDS